MCKKTYLLVVSMLIAGLLTACSGSPTKDSGQAQDNTKKEANASNNALKDEKNNENLMEQDFKVPYTDAINIFKDKYKDADIVDLSLERDLNKFVYTVEDFDLDPLGDIVGRNCETTFEFAVCGERNSECCRQGKGKSVAYKQRGLTVAVRNLVLELRGRCGCTEFVALAFPAVRAGGGCKRRVDYVEFTFNTLSAPICLPADGRAVTLRQEYQTNLTVDCIGKSILKLECNECCEPFYELIIPNDIDLVLCLQETVSTLISEQIVVLASPNPIQPRLVDTFSKVCDFSQCGPNHGSGKPSCHR